MTNTWCLGNVRAFISLFCSEDQTWDLIHTTLDSKIQGVWILEETTPCGEEHHGGSSAFLSSLVTSPTKRMEILRFRNGTAKGLLDNYLKKNPQVSTL